MSFFDEDVSKYYARLVSQDRKKKIQFVVAFPVSIECLLKFATNHGLSGEMLLLDDDGTKVCDFEVLRAFIKRGNTFMVANSMDDWQPRSPRRRKHQMENIALDDIKNHLATLSDKLKKLEDDCIV